MKLKSFAFTLIELMISIALLAILLGTVLSRWNSLGSLSREESYPLASETAMQTRDSLRRVPFDELPPRLEVVKSGGLIDLGTDGIDLESLELRWPDGRPALGEKRVVNGILHLPARWEGRKLILDYRFSSLYLPREGDVFTVPLEAPHTVTLPNRPVIEVEKISLASGNKLKAMSPSSYVLSENDGLVTFSATAAGKVVVVDYRGKAIETWISGEFLDDGLRPQSGFGDLKQIRLDTTYGGDRSIVLGLLKVRP